MEIDFVGEDVSSVDSVRKLLESYPQDCTVSQFVSTLRGELLGEGYMVGDVAVDGVKLVEAEPVLASDYIDRVERLEVEVATAGHFVGSTFAECVSASERLGSLRDTITESVRVGELSRAADDLIEFTEGLAVLVRAYNDGLQILVRVGVVDVDQVEAVQPKITALGEVLEGLLEGIELRDFVLVSDALDYEFPEHFSALSDEFQSWSNRLLHDCPDAAVESGRGAPAPRLVTENDS